MDWHDLASYYIIRIGTLHIIPKKGWKSHLIVGILTVCTHVCVGSPPPAVLVVVSQGVSVAGTPSPSPPLHMPWGCLVAVDCIMEVLSAPAVASTGKDYCQLGWLPTSEFICDCIIVISVCSPANYHSFAGLASRNALVAVDALQTMRPCTSVSTKR